MQKRNINIDIETHVHKVYNFKILGLSNFHQLPWHPADLSHKESDARLSVVYIMRVVYLNFSSGRRKSLDDNNSAALSDAPFYSSQYLFSYLQLATFSPNSLLCHILHYSEELRCSLHQ